MVPGIGGPFLVGQCIDASNSNLVGSGSEGKVEVGLPFYNNIGSTLTKGTLVYPTSYSASGRVVAKADGDASAKFPVYVVAEDVADVLAYPYTGKGMMLERGTLQVASFDTSGSSVGAAVYASGTAGAVTLTNSGGLPVVGRVASPLSASGGSGFVFFDIPGEKANAGTGGTFYAADGTAAAPSMTFATDPDTGTYKFAANSIGWSIGGVSALVLAGSAPTVSAGADTAGQDVYLFATSAGTGTTGAKVGAAFRIRSGAGGPAATTIASGDGGAMAVLAGGGGNKTGTTGATGAGGALSGSAGAGGDNATVTAVAAGIGGAADYRSGTGGNQTGAAASGAGGAGGAAAYGSGAGGNASGAGSTGNGGAGGQLDNTAGAGGTSVGGTGGAGGNFFGRAGAGGNGVTGGAGGTATIRGGNAGTGGNAAGGNVDLIPGTPTGTGLAGEIRVNSSTAGFIPVSFYWGPGSVDTPFFVASRAYRVKSIRTRVEVAGTDGGAVTAVINKAASGTAITAGTILHTGTIDLKGTAATNQTITLTATVADLEIAAGTCIGIDFTGTLTSATGCVTVTLAPV